MVPGVRVENASYSLTISGVHAAVASALSLGRRDFIAVAVDPFASPFESALLRSIGLERRSDSGKETLFRAGSAHLPEPRAYLSPFESAQQISPGSLITGAQRARDRAHVPESSFRVGCVVATRHGNVVSAANVENADWSFILCAERTAVAMSVAYDVGSITHLAISCDHTSGCTPCGACRQVLLELAPDAELWMDRVPGPPVHFTIASLLPAPFSDASLDDQ